MKSLTALFALSLATSCAFAQPRQSEGDGSKLFGPAPQAALPPQPHAPPTHASAPGPQRG